MAPNEEPKMAELKRLLRRLDGLEAQRASGGFTEDEPTQRVYVGSLRGAPDPEDGQNPSLEKNAETRVSPKSAAILAGVITAILSTATAYVLMSAEPRTPAPSSARPVDLQPESTALPSAGRDASMELVRSAVFLLEKGNVEGARELLRRAADLGSGPAALELARSYDPVRGQPQAQAQPHQADPALARVWYERARELGMLEAQSSQKPQTAD